jgi:asparagine synthase (glutamine-hydrolysing)
MCGIAGIASLGGKPPALEELRSMCAALVHRGPDDEGFYLGDGVGLGMRRLSIIDLQTGHQPVRNEDGSVWVVLNGEIYNYRELRLDLERRGHAFYTATDTEVIVHLYEEYGADCVGKLRGMYAFALWDERSRTLLVARDRLGIKPLYYAQFDGRFAFASELKALLQLPGIERRLSWPAMSHLFAFLYTSATDGIVAGVHKLEPGHYLTLAAGGAPRIVKYWDLSFEPDHRTSEAGFAERLRGLLEESVGLHMLADVPLGVFLSGGLDSSAVAATMAKLSTRPIKTFSIGFPEKRYDETPHARAVAQALGADHHELILEPNALESIEDIAWFLDEPFGDSSALPTYMVSKLASRHVSVVLSGDGGDELFAGYDKYAVERKERRRGFIPGPLRHALGGIGRAMREETFGRRFLMHLALDGPERYVDAQTLFGVEQKRSLFKADVLHELMRDEPSRGPSALLAGFDGHWLSALQYFDMKSYLPLDILTKVDRMSMAHSIEARVPLLDHKLVEFAATIPAALKLRKGRTKHIFKEAMRGILPDEIIDRRKQGFAVPIAYWFRGRLSSFLRDLLLSDTSRRRSIFDPAYVEQLIRWHEQGRPLEMQLWTLLSFELWCRTFLDRVPKTYGSSTAHAKPVRSLSAVD